MIASPTVVRRRSRVQRRRRISRPPSLRSRADVPNIVEVLVADGGPRTGRVPIAREHPDVSVLDNPGRIQSAGLNFALAKAQGEVIVRVDGHCVLAPDYVERCVAALTDTGAAMVGGAMTPEAGEGRRRRSRDRRGDDEPDRCGSRPRFHTGGRAGWVDTVYLGAYRLDDVRRSAATPRTSASTRTRSWRSACGSVGGVWFDPANPIVVRASPEHQGGWRSSSTGTDVPERSPFAVIPGRMRPRQLAAPALVLGLVSPQRRAVAAVYGSAIAARTAA